MFGSEFVKSIIEEIISTNGLKDDFYCPCGSGFLYDSCCKNNLDDAWYMKQEVRSELASIWNIISKMPQEKRSIIKHDVVKGLYKIFEKYGRLSSCVDKQCNSPSIQSHLFPKNFIRSLQREGYNFHIEGVSKTLGADSFKTNLWCHSSDSNLFENIDKLGDISGLFQNIPINNGHEVQDDGMMGELFLKVLSFKVKTTILDQMYYFLWLLISDDSPNRKHILELCIKHYKVYNSVLLSFDQLFEVIDGGKWVNFPYCIGKRGLVRGGFEDNKIHYQTNIKMYGDVPVFVVNIVKDGDWMYFIGTTVLDSHKNNVLLESFMDQMSAFKASGNYVGARDRIQKEFFVDNNLYYLSLERGFFGNTYIYGEKK